MKQAFSVLVLCVLALLIAACSGQAGTTSTTSSTSATPTAESAGSSTSSSPAEAARNYIETALATQNDITPLVCSNVADILTAGIAVLKATYGESGTTLDISGLTFTAQNISGDSADVVITGKLKYTVQGAVQESDFPEMTLNMKNDNGWKVCG